MEGEKGWVSRTEDMARWAGGFEALGGRRCRYSRDFEAQPKPRASSLLLDLHSSLLLAGNNCSAYTNALEPPHPLLATEKPRRDARAGIRDIGVGMSYP